MKKVLLGMGIVSMLVSMGCNGNWSALHTAAIHVDEAINLLGSLSQLQWIPL